MAVCSSEERRRLDEHKPDSLVSAMHVNTETGGQIAAAGYRCITLLRGARGGHAIVEGCDSCFGHRKYRIGVDRRRLNRDVSISGRRDFA